jgi:2-dehydropantoate 2-reductase
MNNTDLSIVVVGAGAVGGITAALLKKAGYDVEIVCKYDDYARTISGTGLKARGPWGSFSVTMPAWSISSEISGKKDLVLLAVKANDMIGAINEALPVLKDDGFVVSLQNGLCIDDLAAVAGKAKVIGCIVGWGATMEKQGELFMSSEGDFIIGYSGRKQDQYLQSLAEVLSSVVPVRVTDNIIGHLYSKLIINSCITSLGAVCGMYLGKMLSISKARKIFIEIIREAVVVAGKMGIRIEVFGGRLDFNKFIEDSGMIAGFKRHLMLLLIGFKYRKLKSSSLQSLERGKLTEIDFLNGYIVKNGTRLGVPVPVNSAIVDMIHEIEQGTRKLTPENFDNPVFNRFI